MKNKYKTYSKYSNQNNIKRANVKHELVRLLIDNLPIEDKKSCVATHTYYILPVCPNSLKTMITPY